MTLEEALETPALRVTEKDGGAEVGELAVENSGDRPVFLQAGDTLQGGKHDRTIAKDTLVPPRSGKVLVRAFCVEPGRWSQRASSERGAGASRQTLATSEADFRGNDVPVATKEQRLAIQLEGDQGRVWESGRKAIQALSPGNDSYVLASQDGTLRDKMRAYLDALEPLFAGKEEIVGMAYAINGKVASAEIYGTTGLLHRFWPKLMRRSMLEAMAARGSDTARAPTVEAVERFLRETAQVPESQEAAGAGLERSVRRGSGSVRFDARCAGARVYTRFD